MQLRRENESTLEVPEVGHDSSEKVTKSPEPIVLSGSFLNDKTLENQTNTPQPGLPQKAWTMWKTRELTRPEHLIGRW